MKKFLKRQGLKDYWFQTGDCGTYDNDGNIFFGGRMEDLIKYQSYYVRARVLYLKIQYAISFMMRNNPSISY